MTIAIGYHGASSERVEGPGVERCFETLSQNEQRYAIAGLRTVLFLNQFDPPVPGTAVLAAVVGNRFGLAVTFCGQAADHDAFISQILHHRLRAGVGQRQVGLCRADVVGVATDFQLQFGRQFQRRHPRCRR